LEDFFFGGYRDDDETEDPKDYLAPFIGDEVRFQILTPTFIFME